MKTHPQTGLSPTKTESREALRKRIRARAYELYERRGREDGHAVDDWLRAESEEATREQDGHRARL
jgi:hypothetical protein